MATKANPDVDLLGRFLMVCLGGGRAAVGKIMNQWKMKEARPVALLAFRARLWE